MARVENVLAGLGFSPNEIKVYLVLNDHGSQKAGRVAKLAKIDRSSCYHSLKALQERGLVSYVTVGRARWFQATGPKQLLQYVKEQESAVKDVLPELHERHKARKIEGQVRLYKGKKGIQTIFREKLVVRASLHNAVVLYHDHLVRVPNCAQPVRDHEGCTVLQKCVQCSLDQPFGPGIDTGRRLIQYEQARIRQDGPRNRNKLSLALAQVLATLSQFGRVPLGQPADELIGVG